MFRLGCWLLFLAISVTISTPALAKPEAKGSLSSSSVNIPNPLTYKLEVEWPKNEAAYTFALPELQAKNLELIQQGESEETFIRNKQPWTRKTFSFIFHPQEPGQGIIYDFQLPYIDPDAQKGGNLNIPETSVEIRPKPANISGFLYFLVLGGLIACLTGVLVFRKRKKASIASPIEKSLEDRIFEEMTQLQNTDQGEQERTLAIGKTFKSFLIQIYDMGSAKITERDMMKLLKTKNDAPQSLQIADKLLSQLHEIKYMGASPHPADLRKLQHEMMEFVKGKQVLGNPNS